MWVERFIYIVKKLDLLDVFILLDKFDTIDSLRNNIIIALFLIITCTVNLLTTLHAYFKTWGLLLNFGPWYLRKYVDFSLFHTGRL
jgi:hypothetical protein